MDHYRRLLLQVHHDDIASPLPGRIAALMRAMPVATEVFTRMGIERRWIYHDVGCDVFGPLFDWRVLERGLRAEAPGFFPLGIAVLEGDDGWDDYVTLHDYVEGDR